MNISLITLHTPTRENVRGASALPFHLIANASSDYSFEIFSYNLNNISQDDIAIIECELGAKITILKQNNSFKILKTRLFSLLRGILNYSLFHYLKLPEEIVNRIYCNSDCIWIYAEDIGHLARHFSQEKKCIVTTPDCEALFYSRILGLPAKLHNFFSVARYSRAYWQYINVAKDLPLKNVAYHLVGKEDNRFLHMISPQIKSFFLPHPHYCGNYNRNIEFARPRIRLLIPGRYDFYCREAIDQAISIISQHTELINLYEISFQGKNWDRPAMILKKAGFDVAKIGFVPEYKDELCRHDIQLSPISTGTGTKGKVLDAFINGLLVIATERAIENICVEDKTEFLYYSDPEELIKILKDIPIHIAHYEKIAENGRKAVLKHHNPRSISTEFFSQFKAANKKNNYND